MATDTPSFWVPIEPTNLRLLARRLQSEDVFTPGFDADVDQVYDPCAYRLQAERHGAPTQFLVDRNVLTRWVAAVRSERLSDEIRLAAAVLVFAQCSGIQIEPSSALYEFAYSRGNAAARADLLAFRQADVTHPGYWAEVALGVRNVLPVPQQVPEGPHDRSVDLEHGLRRWRRNYIIALKIAQTELAGGKAEARMLRLIRWMYDDFLLGGPAIMLSALLLAPGGKRARLFKNLRSKDRAKALQGVRNATWDLTLVSQFLSTIEAQETEGGLCVLVSFDKAVHRIARGVLGALRTAEETSPFITLWGEKAGQRIAEAVESAYRDHAASHRQLNRPAPENFVDELIERGEAAVLGWKHST